MAQRGHGIYSRFIGLVKIGLPIFAIILLATVFLVTIDEDFGVDSLVTEEMISELGEDLEIVGPRFSGNTSAGEAYTFTAQKVIPDAAQPNEIKGTGLDGLVQYATGERLHFLAPEAIVNLNDQILNLTGGIELNSSNGSSFRAQGLTAKLDEGEFESQGDVVGQSAMGELEAQKMRVTGSEEGQMVIWLEGNVRLSFDVPENEEGTGPQ